MRRPVPGARPAEASHFHEHIELDKSAAGGSLLLNINPPRAHSQLRGAGLWTCFGKQPAAKHQSVTQI